LNTDLLERNPAKIKPVSSNQFSSLYRIAPVNKYIEGRQSGSGWVISFVDGSTVDILLYCQTRPQASRKMRELSSERGIPALFVE